MTTENGEEMSVDTDLMWEEIAHWSAISKRESAKYQKAHQRFRMLQHEYMNNDEFTRPDQDKNQAWLKDSRTQDDITAMKDAWQCLQAAAARIAVIEVQLANMEQLEAAKKRLAIKAGRFIPTQR